MGLVTAIAAGASLLSSGLQVAGAGKARRDARRQRAQADAKVAAAERSRQAITNPYAGVQDLSGMISNPFANLQVATKAAEMQAEEADISLASTLDTLRATGAGVCRCNCISSSSIKK